LKIIYCKIFSSLLAFDKNFYSDIFTIENFQFKLGAVLPVSVDKKSLNIKMEVCERIVVYVLPTRDAVIGEEQLKNWK